MVYLKGKASGPVPAHPDWGLVGNKCICPIRAIKELYSFIYSLLTPSK